EHAWRSWASARTYEPCRSNLCRVRRNVGRLWQALSGATVIPEAGPRSGSMTTVLAGHELGRGVGAVPGPVTSVTSAGPNELIKQGLASLVTQSSDVIDLLDADRTQDRT